MNIKLCDAKERLKLLTKFGCVEKAFCKLRVFAEIGCLELVFITKTDDSKRLIVAIFRDSYRSLKACQITNNFIYNRSRATAETRASTGHRRPRHVTALQSSRGLPPRHVTSQLQSSMMTSRLTLYWPINRKSCDSMSAP